MMSREEALAVAARVLAEDRVAAGEPALTEDEQDAADLLAIARGARR